MVFIGFSTPRAWNPLSALIRAMTGSRVSHTFLLVEDPLFELRLVLEAHSTGFRLVSFTRFVKENKVIALVAPSHPLQRGLPTAGGWLGDEFDVLGLFGIFLTLLMRYVRQRPWKNPFPTPSALFCSEAVIRTLKASEYPGSETLDDEATTPAELLAFLRADPTCVVHERATLRLWGPLRAQPRRGGWRRRRAELPPPLAAPPTPDAAPPAVETESASTRAAAGR
jgi:hypothetical protein